MLRDRVTVAAIVAIGAVVAGCSFQLAAGTDGGGGDDTPPLPTVSFTETSATTDEESGVVTIMVELSEPASSRVTVPYTFSGEAIHGVTADFTAPLGPLVFEVGEKTKSLAISIVKDTVIEPVERLVIGLGEPTGAVRGADTYTLTISASILPRVTLGMATSTGNEGDPHTLEFILDRMANGTETVDYTVVGITAQSMGAFADFTLASGRVTFAAGSMREVVTLVVLEDQRNELPETLSITLTAPTGVVIDPVGPSTQVHTIADDDGLPSVRFQPAQSTTPEGDTGTTQVSLNVTLSAASGRTVVVPFTVTSATTTATDPSDYTIAGSTVTFPEGVTSVPIVVTIVGDIVDEPNEEIFVAIQAPADGAATLGNQTTRQLTIIDDDSSCQGNGAFRVCYAAAPTGPIALPASIDTTNSSLCESVQPQQWTGMQGQPTSCVIRGTTITNTGITTVTGTRPLVLAATGDITIDTLDVASHRGGTLGPGATTQLASCTTGSQTPGATAGGAGGSFLTTGGDGGTGDNGTTAGGAADAVSAPATLRAGCHGQQGNGGDETGKAGGVVYLVAGGTITITGGINASGSAAVGGGNRSGGSGAGSGGMIVLHAASISAAGATVIANGAGGASGGDNDSTGRSGTDPVLTLPTTQAPGGAGGGTGGAGGAGWAGAADATDGADATNNNQGGGGGGGGGGYVRSNVAITDAVVSAGLIQIIP